MKLGADPRLGHDIKGPGFLARFYEVWAELVRKVNGMASGDLEAFDDTATALPVVSATRGKFVKNSAPSELGTAGSKYVVLGWVCTATGSPATFKECRVLTGA